MNASCRCICGRENTAGAPGRRVHPRPSEDESIQNVAPPEPAGTIPRAARPAGYHGGRRRRIDAPLQTRTPILKRGVQMRSRPVIGLGLVLAIVAGLAVSTNRAAVRD